MTLGEYLSSLENRKLICICDQNYNSLFFIAKDKNDINEYLDYSILNCNILNVIENCTSYSFSYINDGITLIRIEIVKFEEEKEETILN